MLNVYVVRTWSNHRGYVVRSFSKLRLHAPEGHIRLGYLIFVMDVEVIGSWVNLFLPGPTLGLGLATAC